MSTANPEPYSERIRLAEIIADARKLLGAPVISYPSRIGQLEAMLKMLADSAAGALRLNEPESETEKRRAVIITRDGFGLDVS